MVILVLQLMDKNLAQVTGLVNLWRSFVIRDTAWLDRPLDGVCRLVNGVVYSLHVFLVTGVDDVCNDVIIGLLTITGWYECTSTEAAWPGGLDLIVIWGSGMLPIRPKILFWKVTNWNVFARILESAKQDNLARTFPNFRKYNSGDFWAIWFQCCRNF